MENRSQWRCDMQKLQPDSSQEKGNSDEKSGVREDLPLEASQNKIMKTRKTTWLLRWPSLIASVIVLLVFVVVGALLLPQALGNRQLPNNSSRQGPLATS